MLDVGDIAKDPYGNLIVIVNLTETFYIYELLKIATKGDSKEGDLGNRKKSLMENMVQTGDLKVYKSENNKLMKLLYGVENE